MPQHDPTKAARGEERTGSTGLAVRVRDPESGLELATVPVPLAELRDLASEVWWDGIVRRGMPGVQMRDLEFSVRAVAESEGDERCRGIVVNASGPGGAEASQAFSTLAMEGLAHRTAEDLRLQGLLAADGRFTYQLVRDGPGADGVVILPGAGGAGSGAPGGGRVIGRDRTRDLTPLPLDRLRQRSTPVGPPPGERHELFWTAGALEEAERIARLGEAQEPAVETGGVLLGHVAYCARTGEAFVVVADALEAVDADRDAFSLSFSGSTWQRLQAVVRARAATQPGLRILGQCHNHPFSPGEPCPACPGTADCPKHTAFLSEDDRRWTRAVFAAQPWQVSRMYGIDAGGRPRAATFGLRAGWLEERGHRVIEDADFEDIRRRAMDRQRRPRRPTQEPKQESREGR